MEGVLDIFWIVFFGEMLDVGERTESNEFRKRATAETVSCGEGRRGTK